MEERNWIAVASLVFGAAVIGTAAIAVVLYRSANAPIQAVAAPTAAVVAPLPRAPAGARGIEALAARQEIAQLEEMLRRRQELVDEKNEELRRQQERIQRLQRQVRDTLEWASLLESSAAGDGWTEGNADLPPNAVEATSEDISGGEPPTPSITDNLERVELEMELAATQLELSRWQAWGLGEEQRRVALLRRLGPNAVPALVEALQDSNPQARRWACQSLTELGLDGADAIPALERAAGTDADAEVRRLAEVALDAVRE